MIFLAIVISTRDYNRAKHVFSSCTLSLNLHHVSIAWSASTVEFNALKAALRDALFSRSLRRRGEGYENESLTDTGPAPAGCHEYICRLIWRWIAKLSAYLEITPATRRVWNSLGCRTSWNDHPRWRVQCVTMQILIPARVSNYGTKLEDPERVEITKQTLFVESKGGRRG